MQGGFAYSEIMCQIRYQKTFCTKTFIWIVALSTDWKDKTTLLQQAELSAKTNTLQ